MKKVLLGTSAIALAGAFATAASAAEWNVRVGGYYNAMVGYAQTDMPGSNPADYDGVDVLTNTEVFFLPSITLDNGIKIGANIQLEGEESGDQIDESFVYIQGSFGRILIGSENSAGYLMHYGAPNASIISYNSPSTQGFIKWNYFKPDSTHLGTLHSTNVEVGGNNDAKRITYFTPRFSGFQIGVSYAHDGNQDDFTPTDLNDATQVGNIFDIGVNYVQSFGDLNVAVSARYGTGEQGAYNPTVWSAGINIGYAGFTIGGSFAESNEHGGGVDDGTSYDIGASYATGPWTFSLTYFRGENGENVFIGSRRQNDKVDTFGFGVNYALAKGVRLNAFGAYVDMDGAIPGEDVSGFVLGTGIGLSW